MKEPASADRRSRWDSESAYFDGCADRTLLHLEAFDAVVVKRYRDGRRGLFSKEYRFKTLGDLHGRRILDVGCGDGENSVLLARLGAEVVGIDVSANSIAVAQRRAEINGVSAQTTFVCAPLETVTFENGEFDVIWADAFLHHVLPDLNSVMGKLTSWVKPGGILMFSEPLNLSPTLRRLRLALPIAVHGTPDERPLEAEDLDIIRRHVPRLRVRHFSLLARLSRFILTDDPEERVSWQRRFAIVTLARIDRALFWLVPPSRNLGGQGVLWGQRPESLLDEKRDEDHDPAGDGSRGGSASRA